ncbi:hypothetical protein GF351_04230 [Candidatus Woesearchaeota archaeon]|nr:hypothetical protein [Candidatus Woesearchaeota archaeon]
MRKKGQVTLFVILGIMVLLSISLFFYFRLSQIEVPEVTPPEYVPVQDYVEACIYDTGEEAIRQIGLHGGYVEIPFQIDRDPSAYLGLDSQGLLKIPYWYHNMQNRYPSVSFMESQISDFVEQNLDRCLRDFEPMSESFEVTPRGDIEVTTTIAEDDVVIEVDYILNVRLLGEDTESHIGRFSTDFNVRLKRLYDLAVRLLEKENEQTFLENATLDLMAMDSQIPFTQMYISCQRKNWFQQDIEEEIETLLTYYTPRFRVKDTAHAPFAADQETYDYFGSFTLKDIYEGKRPDRELPEDAYDYFHHFFDIGIDRTDLKAGFIYQPGWGMNLVVRPSDGGGLMYSDTARGSTDYFRFFCLNIHHFTYDLSYPLMVVLKDEEAFGGQGYSFRFAMPVIIDHNQPDRKVVGTTLFETPSEYIDFCGEKGDDIYDIRALGVDESGFANMEIDDVNISYDCYKFICRLGSTTAEEGAYKLKTQLPESCSHGYLLAEKQGYLSARQQVLEEKQIFIPIQKLKEMDFEVLRRKYFGRDPPHLASEDLPLDDQTSVMMIIYNYDEDSYYNFREFPVAEDATEDLSKVELIEDTTKYELNLMLLDEDGLILGGYVGNWSVSWQEVADSGKVTFRVVEYIPTPVTEEETYDALNYLQTDTEYQEQLRPVLS